MPNAILGCFAFMEKAGGVAPADKLSELAILRNTVNVITTELQAHAPPTRKAPMMPVSIIGATELAIADASLPLYMRAFAFYKLLRLWSASRASDLEGLDPSSLKMSTHGLSGVLDRTKTSGPGKRIRFLPIFVSCKVFFMNPDWLQQGWSIWCSTEFQFERDYFLPLPNTDGSAAIHSMATYARTLALSKQFLKLLRKPAWGGHTWQLSASPLIEAEAALCFWTEHTERNWLVSVLASLGVPRDKRDYVGRWHIVTASDEYVRTARHVVLSLQEEALRGVCLDERWDLLNGGLEDLPSFLQERGCGERLVQIQSQALQLRSCLRVCLGPQHVRPNSASAAEAPEMVAVDARAPMPAVLQARAEELPPFYIAIVGKGRLRRLHRKGGCGTATRDLREMLPVFELQDAVYDSACKHCWRNGENPGEDAGDGAASSDSHGSDSSSCGSSSSEA